MAYVLACMLAIVLAGSACKNKDKVDVNGAPTPPLQASAVPTPVLSPAIGGDVRVALRELFGTPVRPGQVVATIEPATNGDPQTNAAGVLVATVAGGRVVTVYATGPALSDLHTGGPIDLGAARFLATDGPHVCAASRESLRCAWVDGASASARALAGETTGLWGGPSVLVRGVGAGTQWKLAASSDGFLTERQIQVPHRFMVADLEIESALRWSAVTVPTEGTAKVRLALTNDGGKTAIADFGSVDRLGWSYGDRLWPAQLVTGALATELVVAERGEKQHTLKLPWAAAGGFAWANGSLVLFGRGATGTGGFMLVEVASGTVTTFTPPGTGPIIAAGRVGARLAAVTSDGRVLAW